MKHVLDRLGLGARRWMPALLVASVAGLAHGQIDGTVQWGSASHVANSDRRPILPLEGETFDVIFQTARVDLTTARVAVDEGADGLNVFFVDAQWQSNRGPYDIWRATIPATAARKLSYVIELSDGADTDYLAPAGMSDSMPATDWWTLDFDTMAHAPLGATPTNFGTVFRVWAPNPSYCWVRGTFNNWQLADFLTRLGEDYIGLIPEAQPGDEYKYYMAVQNWRPDPRARFLNNAAGFNSRIIDPLAYEWREPDFTPAPPEEWVVYQLHVGTFAGRNDPVGTTPTHSRYKDVEARVGHLVELGVNAVMLNPINEFPGEKSGGYNPISMFAFESTYGTPDELKSMIDTLHENGIAVILDIVWNHVSSSDNHLWNFDGTQIYFDTPNVNTPWGPQLDLDEDEVFGYYIDSLETVMGEYKMDGYRHDAIYELVSAVQFDAGQDLVREMMARVHTRFDDSHVMGEIYNNSAWNTSPAGIDLDGQYHEAFKNAIYDAVEAAAFGNPDMGRLAAAIDGSGPWVEGDQVFNYYELHDEAWGLSGAGRTRAVALIDTTFPHDDEFAFGRTKLANGLTLLAQGMPAILMGTEWGEDEGWEENKIDWAHKIVYRGLFDYYRDLIGLRTTKRALFANSPANVFHVNDGGDVLAFERSGTDGRSYVVVANFSNTTYSQYQLGLPRGGSWGVLVNSEDADYRGTGLGMEPGAVSVEPIARDGFAQRTTLELAPHSLLLLQHDPEYLGGALPCSPADVTSTAEPGVPDGIVNLADFSQYLTWWAGGDQRADLSGTASPGEPDEIVNLADFTYFLTAWSAGCP